MARPALMLLAALLGVTATVTPALAQYRIGMSAAIAAVLVTITLGILLRAAIVLVYTDRIRHPLPLLGLANPPRRLPGGAVVSTFDLLTVAVAATLFVGLFAFLPALAARHPDARGRRETAARRSARDQLPAAVRALVG